MCLTIPVLMKLIIYNTLKRYLTFILFFLQNVWFVLWPKLFVQYGQGDDLCNVCMCGQPINDLSTVTVALFKYVCV